jgi:hypothetical protein
VNKSVVREQILVDAEIEPVVEVLGKRAHTVVERYQLDLAYVHRRLRS